MGCYDLGGLRQNVGMKRTHVFLPEPMLEALKAMSIEHDIAVSELIRAAIGLFLAPPARKIDNLIGMTTVGSWEDEEEASDLAPPFSTGPADDNRPVEGVADPVRFLRTHLPNFVRAQGDVSADELNIVGRAEQPKKD